MADAMRRVAVLALSLLGCSSSGSSPSDPDGPPVVDDAKLDGPLDKSGGCVDTFGDALTDGFGRLDGTIVAVLAPGNTTCTAPNSTHMVIEVRQNGDVYRMVAAMESTVGDPVMALAERDAPLAGPSWQEGWHPGVAFDYVGTLGLHRLDFTPTPEPELVYAITDELQVGARVSVFATVENVTDSAHLIHRNETDKDGAIVIDPDTAPHYMMLRFDNQLF